MTGQRQLAWDPEPLSRSSDPRSSYQAAHAVKEGAAAHRERIVACLLEYGPQTAKEIGARLGLTNVQVCRRLPELRKKRKARTTDKPRDRQQVWTATAQALRKREVGRG